MHAWIHSAPHDLVGERVGDVPTKSYRDTRLDGNTVDCEFTVVSVRWGGLR